MNIKYIYKFTNYFDRYNDNYKGFGKTSNREDG
jgi:hypothetical protein